MSALASALLSSRPAKGLSRPAAAKGASLCRPGLLHRTSSRQGTALQVYPNATFIENTITAFEEGEKNVATPDEAMCLLKEADFVLLDVRSDLAVDTIGRIPGSNHVPIVTAKRRFDGETRQNVVTTEDLPVEDFVAKVEKKFPDKENTRLLIYCATGRTFSINALIALDEAGYDWLVGLKGGYNSWIHTFDNNFRRRGNPKYETVYNADGDAMGIHSTGAGFQMVDELVLYTSDDF